ncbi:phosphatase PAP2 family protein [Porticoccaceae bacterium LTM1]|nr:phosphatase PAP2 family protein [Porticoccaceae bacterium LTM1]
MKVFEAIHQFDVRAFMWCMRRKRVALWSRLSRTISRTADGYFYPVIALAMLWLNEARGETIFWAIIIGFAIERAAYFTLKNLLKRNRPADALPEFESYIIPSDKFSLPSGHTSAAFLMAGLLCHFYAPLIWLLYPWACLVGASRVFLGVHFPTDILAGAVMGSSIALLILSWV